MYLQGTVANKVNIRKIQKLIKSIDFIPLYHRVSVALQLWHLRPHLSSSDWQLGSPEEDVGVSRRSGAEHLTGEVVGLPRQEIKTLTHQLGSHRGNWKIIV